MQHISSTAAKESSITTTAIITTIRGPHIFTVRVVGLTRPPSPTKKSKGKREGCPGADPGQTFNTFADWTRAEIWKTNTGINYRKNNKLKGLTKTSHNGCVLYSTFSCLHLYMYKSYCLFQEHMIDNSLISKPLEGSLVLSGPRVNLQLLMSQSKHCTTVTVNT